MPNQIQLLRIIKDTNNHLQYRINSRWNDAIKWHPNKNFFITSRKETKSFEISFFTYARWVYCINFLWYNCTSMKVTSQISDYASIDILIIGVPERYTIISLISQPFLYTMKVRKKCFTRFVFEMRGKIYYLSTWSHIIIGGFPNCILNDRRFIFFVHRRWC